MKRSLSVSTLLVLSLSGAIGQGTIRWDEAVNGSLANSPETATSLGLFGFGTNTILGLSEAQPVDSSWAVYADCFIFDLPSGARLSSILYTSDRQTWVWLGDPTFN